MKIQGVGIKVVCFGAGLLVLFTTFAANAARLPLWELGGAIAYGQIPYYRGSASSRNVVLPLPLAIYRGEKYGLDREGAHRWLFKNPRFRLDLSMALGLPVPKNAKIKAREGMPELDTLLEAGPILDVLLWKNNFQSISVHFPLRLAVSLNWQHSALQGAVFAPYFHYSIKSFERNYWEFNRSMGPTFGSQAYHAYYYSVASQYKTNQRPEYTAAAGYSGSRVTVYVNKRLGKLWMSAFARYDVLQDAAFIQSPLVEKSRYLIGGFVIGWVFADSPRSVSINQASW